MDSFSLRVRRGGFYMPEAVLISREQALIKSRAQSLWMSTLNVVMRRIRCQYFTCGV